MLVCYINKLAYCIHYYIIVVYLGKLDYIYTEYRCSATARNMIFSFFYLNLFINRVFPCLAYNVIVFYN